MSVHWEAWIQIPREEPSLHEVGARKYCALQLVTDACICLGGGAYASIYTEDNSRVSSALGLVARASAADCESRVARPAYGNAKRVSYFGRFH